MCGKVADARVSGAFFFVVVADAGLKLLREGSFGMGYGEVCSPLAGLLFRSGVLMRFEL